MRVESYVKAVSEMEARIRKLTRQRDDARAELSNYGPMLIKSTELNAELGRALSDHRDEIAELQSQIRDLADLIAQLEEQANA
jgi:predicted  nucleic acid-binding Zn-ribbon protein